MLSTGLLASTTADVGVARCAPCPSPETGSSFRAVTLATCPSDYFFEEWSFPGTTACPAFREGGMNQTCKPFEATVLSYSYIFLY